MEIFETILEIRTHIQAQKRDNQSVGFVPTMGALHEGHMKLLQEAKKENSLVVCSIFVNPIQFNNTQDLKNYPRTFEEDRKKLENAGCDILFHPTVEEMYPEPDNSVYDFGGLENVLEGKFRPGHFNGVGIVVKKLFEIVEPHRAYFGLKDYQQLVIINKLVKDYDIPVEIIPCPTVRERDGLAMSSRNKLLTPRERKIAPLIYQTLKMVKIQSGYETVSELKNFVIETFVKNKSLKLEYFEIVDMYSLKPIKTWVESHHVIACIAVYLGKVRLIDNIILFS
jgi:pantoate--beta-alanine ligase